MKDINEFKIRDVLAFPFALLMIIFGYIAVQIGGVWTTKQIFIKKP